jgi:outer membrane receptor protein involved in Fe transport
MRHSLISFFSFLLFHTSFAQNHTLSGYIKDSLNRETLIKAQIIGTTPNGKEFRSSTNSYGFFSIMLPAGQIQITVAAASHEVFTESFTLTQNIERNYYLAPELDLIGTVTIKAKKNDNVKSLDISTQNISGQTIKKIPALLGEADVIKSIQLLPGVTTVGEGASGFNVRGGSIDQNLVLMDEAPVFNSAHLFGFFSIFNPDAVKDVELVKGGIPANYGGRLSSTLDVKTRDGNKRQ